MTAYSPGDQGDLPLLNWFMQLWVDEDIQKLLGPSLWPMAAFMRHFTDAGAVVLYEADDVGWWIVSFTFPFMGGGTWGLWVRKDKRASGSRIGLDHIMRSLDFATTRYPVLVNTTKQPEIIAKTQRLGYTYLGMIPFLFEGEDCHVLHMTRETFAPIFDRWSTHVRSRRKD